MSNELFHERGERARDTRTSLPRASPSKPIIQHEDGPDAGFERFTLDSYKDELEST